MNHSTSVALEDTANRIVGQLKGELSRLFELTEELCPGAEEQPRWSAHNRTLLLREAGRSVEHLNKLVAGLRSLQMEAEPELQQRLDAALLAAELLVDTAAGALHHLGQFPVIWRPTGPKVPWSH